MNRLENIHRYLADSAASSTSPQNTHPRSVMYFKVTLVMACLLAITKAGFLAAPPLHYQQVLAPAELSSTSDNIVRSPGNLAQISTQSKSVSTPFSSSSRSEIRVSNPAIYAQHYAAAPAPIGAPLIPTHNQLLGVAYSPAVAVSHASYSSPIGISYAY